MHFKYFAHHCNISGLRVILLLLDLQLYTIIATLKFRVESNINSKMNYESYMIAITVKRKTEVSLFRVDEFVKFD